MDAPRSDLASALGLQAGKAEDFQETLQRVLDQREEERQSKQLLQLYLKAVDKEGQQDEESQPSQEGTAISSCFCFHYFVSLHNGDRSGLLRYLGWPSVNISELLLISRRKEEFIRPHKTCIKLNHLGNYAN